MYSSIPALFLILFVSTSVSGECTISKDCTKESYTICDVSSKTCVCDPSSQFLSSETGTCTPLPTTLGDSCEINEHCQTLPNAVQNMSCFKEIDSDKGKCGCSIGYTDKNFKCEPINCEVDPNICSINEYCDKNDLLCKNKKDLGDDCESDIECNVINYQYCTSTGVCDQIIEFGWTANIFDKDSCSGFNCSGCDIDKYCKNGICELKIDLGYLCDCPGPNQCKGVNAHCNNHTVSEFYHCECKEGYKSNPDWNENSNVDINCILKTCPLEKDCDEETEYCDVDAGTCKKLKSFNSVCNGSFECAGVQIQNIACVDRQSTGVMTCNCAIGFVPNLPTDDENMKCIELMENKECTGTDVFGNEWTAFPGETKTRLCPGRQQGLAEWKCGNNGINFKDPQPNYRNCTTEWVIKLAVRLQDEMFDDGSIYYSKAIYFMSEMKKLLDTAFIADGILAMDEDVELQFFGHEIQNMINLIEIIAANVTFTDQTPSTDIPTTEVVTETKTTTSPTTTTTFPTTTTTSLTTTTAESVIPRIKYPTTIFSPDFELLNNIMLNGTLEIFAKVTTDVLVIMDTMLKFQKPWKQLTPTIRTMTFFNVLNAIQATSFRLADLLDGDTDYLTFDLKAFSVTTGVLKEFVYPVNSGRRKGKDSFIELSFPNWENVSSVIQDYSFVGIDIDIEYVKRIVNAQIMNMKDLRIESSKLINSNALLFTLSNGNEEIIPNGDVKVIITFHHDSDAWGESPQKLARKLHSSESPKAVKGATQCTRFDEGQKIWTTAGCELLEARLYTSTCSCDQLGMYGLQSEFHQYHGKTAAFEGVTITCYIIAILLLGISIYITKSQQVEDKIKMIMMICLLVNNFLLGFFVDKHYINLSNSWCYIVGMLSHFFGLCSIMCLSLAGIHNYFFHEDKNTVSSSTNKTSNEGLFGGIRTLISKHKKISYVAYVVGVPLFILAVIMITGAATGSKSYSRVYGGDFCWLDGSYIWAYFAPGLVALIVNTLLCSVITRRINHTLQTNKRRQPEGSTTELLKQRATMKWNVIFSIVVGISWAVGYYQLGPNYSDSELTQFAFPILMFLQGVIIFVFELTRMNAHGNFKKRLQNSLGEKKDKQAPTLKIDNGINENSENGSLENSASINSSTRRIRPPRPASRLSRNIPNEIRERRDSTEYSDEATYANYPTRNITINSKRNHIHPPRSMQVKGVNPTINVQVHDGPGTSRA